MSVERDTMAAQVGSLLLVDLGPDVPPLSVELDRQRREALEQKQTLVIWLALRDCPPCLGVAAALPDRRVQAALGRARLVRIDAAEFAQELAELGFPLEVFPAFALINTNNRPVDYLSGEEWDEDLPANIAPILGRFVKRDLAQRRHPWENRPRDDETPI
jgi:hypothetical protein